MAVQQALHDLPDPRSAALAVVVVPSEYPAEAVRSTLVSELRGVPFFGFSSAGQLHQHRQVDEQIIVAVLAGDGLDVRTAWWPGIDGELPTNVRESLAPNEDNPVILAVDGTRADAQALTQLLDGLHVVGCVTGGEMSHPNENYQLAGEAAGVGGVAGLHISGRVKLGVGMAHGWTPVGLYSKVTQADGLWIRTLDERPAAEFYANLFSIESYDWLSPLLKDMIRMYPLGIEQVGTGEMQICAPVRIEADGSFRMMTSVVPGSTGHVMVGSIMECERAIRQACSQALAALGNAQPVLAVVCVDVAWKTIFESEPTRIPRIMSDALGIDIPVVGGYSLGQIMTPDRAPQVLNQHFEVILIGA